MPVTRVGTVNQTGSSGCAVVFMVKTHLAANGWTVIGSGDGLSAFSNTGDIITSAGTGAGGIGNPRAWFVIKDPGNNRALVFQRTSAASSVTNDNIWRVANAETVTWTGGSATVSHSAAAEGNITGSGTAASPVFASLFNISAAARMHIVSDPVPIPGSNVYPFWFAVNTAGSTTSVGVFIVDGLRAGTYDAGDTAPWFSAFALNSLAAFGSGMFAAYKFWVNGSWAPSAAISSYGVSNSGAPASSLGYGVDPIGGFDWLLDAILFKLGSSPPAGIKGVAATFKLPTVNRLFGHTVNLATDPYIYWQGSPAVALPWITGVVPTL